MRISGLASGMDIDAMVKQLMTAEKVPLNKLNQQKQLLEWKREGYREVSTALVSLNEKLSKLSLSSAIDSKKATVTGTTNVLTANATGAAANSVLNISVNNLATASSVVSTGGKAGATKISEIYSGTETSITVGGATIEFTADETIASLVSKINSNKSSGVTAVYDSVSGQMSLTNSETGAKDMTLSGGLLSGLGLTSAKVTKGTDASVTINGITTSQSSNEFTINGVEISLTGAAPGQTTTIQVSQDIDKMVETITSFVETYNSILATFNSKTSEERYRTYLPLTSDQKDEMSDDEIELWTTKAKSGMLKNDSILDQTISSYRSALAANVKLSDGTEINLASFGITTGGYSEKGKLYIDETKLRSALESNSEGAYALFGQTDGSTTTSYTEKDGLFNRIKKVSTNSLKLLYDKAGTSRTSSDVTTAFLSQSVMGIQLTDFEKRIEALGDRLTIKENNYYKQFTAMETAMNKYNSTSSSLTSMLS